MAAPGAIGRPWCGPAGQDAKGLDARRWFGVGKRVVTARWMELIGHVAHPRTWAMKEFGAMALLKHLLWQDPPELTETSIVSARHSKRWATALIWRCRPRRCVLRLCQ